MAEAIINLNSRTPQQPHTRPRLACVAVDGVPFVDPQSGRVIEFTLWIPGSYEMTIRVKDIPSAWARFYVDVDEDGRARVRIVDKSFPDGDGLTALERELLDGLAQIIARSILRQRVVK